MPISLQDLLTALEGYLGSPFDAPQRDAISHGTGPLWIIAGPGTGKTEVLVDRCLKLVCVDGISPLAILVTTFTEKAATSLQDRLYDHLSRLQSQFAPRLDDVDISDLRVGTLHSLCNEIMQACRHVDYQNVRLLDDIEQSLFIRDNLAMSLRGRTQIWSALSYLVDGRGAAGGHPPNLWQITRAAKLLFNRLIEDRLDLARMRAAGGAWAELADEYDGYVQALQTQRRCDFAHLQAHFLNFLQTPKGQHFRDGDGTIHNPGISYLLVDEYQDTNPIQEGIYFCLADRLAHNLTVVGDDDQALYRFRGGTVDCMVSFGARCQARWPGIPVRTIPLVDNHRSHPAIVTWCNNFVTSFAVMQQAGARAPGKQALAAASGVSGSYPAVGWIDAARATDLPARFVDAATGLRANGIITDYSQCVLLMPSTKETARYAGPYVTALNAAQVPVYNPRSKAYVDREEVAAALGALLAILDPGQAVAQTVQIPGVAALASAWSAAYTATSQQHPGLAAYVRASQTAIAGQPCDAEIRPAMPTILFRLLSFDPFVTWQNDPDRDARLSKLTRLFEAYCSLVGRAIKTDRQQQGCVSRSWLRKFYYLLMGYLDSSGMDDDELDEFICPPGRLPIMTIHQAKGLQFPFVFVGAVGMSASPGGIHQLEDDLMQFHIALPSTTSTASVRAEQDLVRMFYVAYSRAEYALIILATRSQLSPAGRVACGGQGIGWFNQRVQRL